MSRISDIPNIYGSQNTGGAKAPDTDKSFVFQAPGTAPSPASLIFSNNMVKIRGITVANQSNCIVGLYTNRQASGLPDITITSGQMVAIPIASSVLVGISFAPPGGEAPYGTIYAHITTETVVATFSNIIVPTQDSGVWDTALWDQANFG